MHSNDDLLLGGQITLRELDRGAQQNLDLLQLPAVLPVQFGRGAREVLGALDSNLLR
jgi:hypothetical protein